MDFLYICLRLVFRIGDHWTHVAARFGNGAGLDFGGHWIARYGNLLRWAQVLSEGLISLLEDLRHDRRVGGGLSPVAATTPRLLGADRCFLLMLGHVHRRGGLRSIDGCPGGNVALRCAVEVETLLNGSAALGSLELHLLLDDALTTLRAHAGPVVDHSLHRLLIDGHSV